MDHFEKHRKWCKEHPIQWWWIRFKIDIEQKIHQSWFGKKYWGTNYDFCSLSNKPENINPCWQVRFYVWRMRKAGFNPLYYTWYMGEHTLIFAEKDEAHRAYQKYEEPDGTTFSAWWHGLDDDNFPNDLLEYQENWIEV